MEQDNNNEQDPSEDLEAKDMDNNLRDDEPALDTIGDDEAEKKIKGGGNVLVNSSTEQVELELPSGTKISLSSGNQSVQELCGLCLWVFDEIKKRKIDGKENGGGYIN